MEYGAALKVTGPVNVDFDGVPQSVWNRYSTMLWWISSTPAYGSGAPAGGSLAPSRSAGSSCGSFDTSGKCLTISRAGLPCNILARSKTIAARPSVPPTIPSNRLALR